MIVQVTFFLSFIGKSLNTYPYLKYYQIITLFFLYFMLYIPMITLKLINLNDTLVDLLIMIYIY